MMYELFSRARKDGLMALETDSDAPDQSPILSNYHILCFRLLTISDV
jgi:flagellar motor component MotA